MSHDECKMDLIHDHTMWLDIKLRVCVGGGCEWLVEHIQQQEMSRDFLPEPQIFAD